VMKKRRDTNAHLRAELADAHSIMHTLRGLKDDYFQRMCRLERMVGDGEAFVKQLRYVEAFLDDLGTVSDEDVDYGEPALWGSFRDNARTERDRVSRLLAALSPSVGEAPEAGSSAVSLPEVPQPCDERRSKC
jgi:hypothetical protein